MERERIEDGFTTTDPLLSTGGDTPAPATLVVVFSTLVAVSGSFVFGSAVSSFLLCSLINLIELI